MDVTPHSLFLIKTKEPQPAADGAPKVEGTEKKGNDTKLCHFLSLEESKAKEPSKARPKEVTES